MVSAPSIRLLHDRTLSTSVTHCLPSPTLDLIAVVLGNGSVTLYRTPFQKLASLTPCKPDGNIISLAWCPDGHRFALSTSASDLQIYSVDRSAFSKRSVRGTCGGPLQSMDVEEQVCAIGWSDVLQGGYYEDRSGKLEGKGVEERRIIVTGGVNGGIMLVTDDLKFVIARVRVFETRIGFLSVEKGMEEVVCGGGDMVCRVDLKEVRKRWGEIERVGREVVAMDETREEMEKICGVMEENWVKGCMKVVQDKIYEPLQSVLGEFGGDYVEAKEALYSIFCGARVGGGVLQFLGGELTENGAKEVLRGYRGMGEESKQGFYKGVKVWEEEMFRASEFEGLGKLRGFKEIGVRGRLEEVKKVWEGMNWEIEEIEKETEEFLAWVVVVCGRIGGRGGNWGGEMELVKGYFEREREWKVMDIGGWVNKCEDIGKGVCQVVSELITVGEKVCLGGTVRNVIGAVVGLGRSGEVLALNRKEGTVQTVYAGDNTVLDIGCIGEKLVAVKETTQGKFAVGLIGRHGVEQAEEWGGQGEITLVVEHSRKVVAVVQGAKRVLLFVVTG